MRNLEFLWETHGIHVGTGSDHVEHGLDNVEDVVRLGIEYGFPAITFIIHTPRLTRYRYESEKRTGTKFIRGDSAYFTYSERMRRIRSQYRDQIQIRFGIELDWLGSEIGMQWSRSKLFQADGADFVVGSVHFSREGIPYDGSPEESRTLIDLRGGLEEFWMGYFDDMSEMIDSFRGLIQVVGHLDLPKIFAPLPDRLKTPDSADDKSVRRFLTLLDLIRSYNLAIDVNLAGQRKGCGIYPSQSWLKYAFELGIPVAIGTDAHSIDEVGRGYRVALDHARRAGYRFYVSFARGILETRPFMPADFHFVRVLNLGLELLNLRLQGSEEQLEMPRLSFGGPFRILSEAFPDAVSLGSYSAVRVSKHGHSVTLSDSSPELRSVVPRCLYSHHKDIPGTLLILLNALASEGINVETAFLYPSEDGYGTAYLTLSGPLDGLDDAIKFVRGTARDRFITLESKVNESLPPFRPAATFLVELDGVEVPIPITRQMIVTIHSNLPGVLLILLSALASRNVNVRDLQLGSRGDRGYAVLGVEGDEREVAEVLPELGPQFAEASHIVLTYDDPNGTPENSL